MKIRIFLLMFILGASVIHTEAQTAPLTLLFSRTALEIGKSTVIDLLIDCQVESCAAVDVTVHYNAEFLRIDNVTLGEFPVQAGHTVQILENRVHPDQPSFTLRYITFSDSSLPNRGSGVLAHITVTALATGAAQFHFSSALVASQDGAMLFSPQTLDGTFDVQPATARYTVSVMSEAGAPDQVTVKSQGTVNPLVSEMVIGPNLQIEFDSQTTALLLFDAPGHLACTMNGSTNRTIILRAGDVNDDGQIDLLDAVSVGIAVSRNQSGSADINRDHIVDIFDLISIGRNYGLRSGDC